MALGDAKSERDVDPTLRPDSRLAFRRPRRQMHGAHRTQGIIFADEHNPHSRIQLSLDILRNKQEGLKGRILFVNEKHELLTTKLAEFASEGLGGSDQSDMDNEIIETDVSADDDQVEEVDRMVPRMCSLE